MKFRTEYTPAANPGIRLTPSMPLLFIGSCFSVNIGTRLERMMWRTVVNPCGVLYNPASIAMSITKAIDGETPRMEYNESSGLWFSWDFSTLFSSPRREEAERRTAEGMVALKERVADSGALLVTFGTAWIYELEDGMVVANCHKRPAKMFRRRLMGVDEITGLWSPLIERLKALNPGIKIIFTVSPVRHLADGFAGNLRSKARLILACEELSRLPGCDYFPAYEILTDDLRDYRFYADDLLHPTEFAADYIMEKFIATYVPEEEFPHLQQGIKEYKRLNHRNLHC